MEQDFYDDSSRSLGLNHSAKLDKNDPRKQSTQGPPLPEGVRAGELDHPIIHDPKIRTAKDTAYDERYVGNPDEALAAQDEGDERDPKSFDDWQRMQQDAGHAASGSNRSSSGKQKKKRPKPLSHVERLRDIEMPESEEQRAQRLADEAKRKAEYGKTVGAPLKGAEPRMVVAGRMEPTKVAQLNKATGVSVVGFAEVFHDLIVEAGRSDAGREALNIAIEQWVEGARDVA